MIMKSMRFCTIKLQCIVVITTALIGAAQAQSLKVKIVGNGQPILFIPGLACNGDVWNETVEVLKDQFECHVLTLPGFGGNEAIDVSDGFLPKMKDRIVNYIVENNLENPILIGHSLGGFLALDISSSYPELVHKSVIVDGLPFLAAIQNPAATEETMKSVAKNMSSMYENMSSEQYASQQKMVLATMVTDSADLEMVYNWGKRSDKKTVSRAMYELYTTDLRDDVAQIIAPTLVLGAWIAYEQYGSTKEMTLSNYTRQYEQLKGVKIELSDRGKHFIMLDDFEFFIQQVGSFIGFKS